MSRPETWIRRRSRRSSRSSGCWRRSSAKGGLRRSMPRTPCCSLGRCRRSRLRGKWNCRLPGTGRSEHGQKGKRCRQSPRHPRRAKPIGQWRSPKARQVKSAVGCLVQAEGRRRLKGDHAEGWLPQYIFIFAEQFISLLGRSVYSGYKCWGLNCFRICLMHLFDGRTRYIFPVRFFAPRLLEISYNTSCPFSLSVQVLKNFRRP